VLNSIVAKVEELSSRIVIVDSFRTLPMKAAGNGRMDLQEFVQRLATKLTSCQATTFLLGEYPPEQIREHPVFIMADGLLTLTQRVRGNAPQPGLHTIRISQVGVTAFPRLLNLSRKRKEPSSEPSSKRPHPSIWISRGHSASISSAPSSWGSCRTAATAGSRMNDTL
jgi:circadian clock protein KaiC